MKRRDILKAIGATAAIIPLSGAASALEYIEKEMSSHPIEANKQGATLDLKGHDIVVRFEYNTQDAEGCHANFRHFLKCAGKPFIELSYGDEMDFRYVVDAEGTPEEWAAKDENKHDFQFAVERIETNLKNLMPIFEDPRVVYAIDREQLRQKADKFRAISSRLFVRERVSPTLLWIANTL